MIKRHHALFFVYFILSFSAFAAYEAPDPLESIALSDETKERVIQQNEVFSDCTVESFKEKNEEKQKLEFKILGLHPNQCALALGKLSRYEEYSKYLSSYVKKSQYSDLSQMISLSIEHDLFPISFILRFKIPRIKTPGSYPFTFPTGFLKDLKGKIHVYNYKNKCLFYTEASWKGKKTQFSDTIISIFAQTVSRISMEKMFKISQF